MTMLRNLMELGRTKLDCCFDIPAHFDDTLDINDASTIDKCIAMFELPRARFVTNQVGEKEKPSLRQCMLFLQEVGRRAETFSSAQAPTDDVDRAVHSGIDDCEEVPWGDLPHSMRELIVSVQPFPDGHLYVLFRNEAALRKSFADFTALRGLSQQPDATISSLKVCHALDNASGLKDGDFLSEMEQEACLRHVLHVKVIYHTRELADLFILRGEHTNPSLKAAHERLAPHQKMFHEGKLYPPIGVVPRGKFPNNSTGSGEGYQWPHISEYAEYAKRSASSAWDIIESEGLAPSPEHGTARPEDAIADVMSVMTV